MEGAVLAGKWKAKANLNIEEREKQTSAEGQEGGSTASRRTC